MALIRCEECGQMISDQADHCPHCGSPLKTYHPDQPKPSSHKWLYAIVGALSMAILALIIAGLSSGWFSSKEDAAPKKDTVVVIKESAGREAVETPASSPAQTMMVFADSYDGFVNIRQRPSGQSAILGTLVNGGEGAVYLGASGSWYKINLNGIVGYVNSKYVTTSSHSSSPASTRKVYYVVIGSWDNLANAKSYYASVPDMLDGGSIYKAVAKGKVVYRMGIAECSSRAEAKDYINTLKGWNQYWAQNMWIWESNGPGQCVYRP